MIRGVPPTSRQTQWNFQNKKLYNFFLILTFFHLLFLTLFLLLLNVSFGLFFSFFSRLEFLFLSIKFLFHSNVGFPLFIFAYLKVWSIELFWNLIDFGFKKMREKLYEFLFTHIFETQIHIQTQIRKTFILALATIDFL